MRNSITIYVEKTSQNPFAASHFIIIFLCSHTSLSHTHNNSCYHEIMKNETWNDSSE